ACQRELGVAAAAATEEGHAGQGGQQGDAEQSSANYVAVRADERSGYEPYMLGVALLAALAGVALFRGGRRRDPELALTRTTFDDPRSRTYRR
ncbi:MAG: hypothetical protein ACKOTH_00905, partial [Solirubrobacterales bacterium]